MYVNMEGLFLNGPHLSVLTQCTDATAREGPPERDDTEWRMLGINCNHNHTVNTNICIALLDQIISSENEFVNK
jgi:hypothetical protein